MILAHAPAEDKLIPEGIVAAAITPRREGPELDLAAAFELIDFLCSKKPAGIALLTVTGEFPHFTLEERSRLVTLAVKRSRVPVIAGVSHTTFDGALSLAKNAAYAGVAALLVMPPPFYRYEQDEVREFFHNLADQLADSTPLLIHNAPGYSSEIAPDIIADLTASGLYAGVVGGNGGLWLCGDDLHFVAARSAGAHGALSPVACVLPELMIALDQAVATGARDRTASLEARLKDFLERISGFPEPFGIREALAARGVKTGIPATPAGPRTLQRLAEFRAWFRDWFPPVIKESLE